MPALAKTALAAGTCAAIAGATEEGRDPAFLCAIHLSSRSFPDSTRVLVTRSPLPPPPVSTNKNIVLPHDQVINAAAAVGAAGGLGVLVGVYRVRLNRCRCTKDERGEVKQGGAYFPITTHILPP
tara:strand:- start:379 stop:753 length:375 start_codon:yes stop_codon:yes gene_type:complete